MLLTSHLRGSITNPITHNLSLLISVIFGMVITKDLNVRVNPCRVQTDRIKQRVTPFSSPVSLSGGVVILILPIRRLITDPNTNLSLLISVTSIMVIGKDLNVRVTPCRVQTGRIRQRVTPFVFSFSLSDGAMLPHS